MLSAVNHVLLDCRALMDVATLVKLHCVLVQLRYHWIGMALVAP
jgi:hypothetical protein